MGDEDGGKTTGAADTLADTLDPPPTARVGAPHAETAGETGLEPLYVISGELGRGAIGRVLRAHDTRLGRPVAIKALLSPTDDTRARFLREARLTARLQHPSIVPIYELGHNEDGTPYYAMKLISGQPFNEVIDAAAGREERLALLPHVIAVALAIAYAHDHGIIHRDLKPSNVVVGAFGETVVIDWGLAKDLLESPRREAPAPKVPAPSSRSARANVAMSDTLLALPASANAGYATMVGAVVGTPAYMPQEQWRGAAVDERADVFALGALLYQTLTGVTPYSGGSLADMLARVDAGNWVPIEERDAGIPKELAAILDIAMARDPADRYPTAKELAADLTRFQTGQLVRAHRYSVGALIARWVRRHRALVTAVLVSLIVLAVSGAVAVRRVVRERDRADRQSLSLLEQQGKDELEAGHPFRASVFLSEAYLHDPGNLVLKSLLTESLRPLRAHRIALTGHTHDVPTAEYSPDGTLIVTASTDRTARIWDARTGATLHVLGNHLGYLEWASFRGDGKSVATASGGVQPRVSLWDVASGSLLRTFDVPDIWRVAFTPDGGGIVTGDHSGNVRILDAETGSVRFESSRHTSRIASIAFSASGSEMAVASWDKTVSIWDWRTGTLRTVLADHESELTHVDYSRDGRFLLIAENENYVRIHDARTLVRLRTLRLPEGAVDSMAVFAPDARTIITGSHDGRVRVWHTSSGALLRLIDVQPTGKLFNVAVRPDGQEVVTLGLLGGVHVWSLDRDLDYRVLEPEPMVDAMVQPSMYIGDGKTILMPRSDGLVREIDAASGSPNHSIHVTGDTYLVAPDRATEHLAVTGETFSSFPPRVWDLRSGALVAELPGHPKPITWALCATRDGASFVTGAYDGTVRIWDARSGELRATYAVATTRISSVAAHPDGQTIAVATDVGVIHFIDRATGRTSSTLAAHPSWIQWMEYTPDGSTLLTVGRQDHTVKLWRGASPKPALVLTGHTGNVERATLSPDGSRVATASVDGTARMWDARTGELLRVIHGPVTTAAFSVTGDELLTTGPRGYAVLWKVGLDPRSPAEIAAYVAEKSPWHLVEGRLELAASP